MMLLKKRFPMKLYNIKGSIRRIKNAQVRHHFIITEDDQDFIAQWENTLKYDNLDINNKLVQLCRKFNVEAVVFGAGLRALGLDRKEKNESKYKTRKNINIFK